MLGGKYAGDFKVETLVDDALDVSIRFSMVATTFLCFDPLELSDIGVQ